MSKLNDLNSSPVPTASGREGSGVKANINVTPMIDVMLVLLIIFMVVTPVLLSKSVNLPSALTAAPEKDDRVTLIIDVQGRYFIGKNREVIPTARLTEALRQEYADRPQDHVLYLKADQSVEYSAVLTAINKARAAGVVRIGAITTAPKNISQ